ncbi:hypothetical protein AB5I83_08420 [Mesobacillus sp. LC4]
MSEFFIKIGKEQVAVSEEIYKEYYRMDRRQRYLEQDIKVGRIAVDHEAETVDFIPSKEDSINRLIELGSDFEDDQMIEDILCDKATMLILQEAMDDLNEKEQELIKALGETQGRGDGSRVSSGVGRDVGTVLASHSGVERGTRGRFSCCAKKGTMSGVNCSSCLLILCSSSKRKIFDCRRRIKSAVLAYGVSI